MLCLHAAMEADGSLGPFLHAVASQTKASGRAAPSSAAALSPAQLAEAIAPVLFRPPARSTPTS
eukprot:COSAG03_NODE_24440_length_272_cov_0.647399_1_plen_63_part_01